MQIYSKVCLFMIQTACLMEVSSVNGVGFGGEKGGCLFLRIKSAGSLLDFPKDSPRLNIYLVYMIELVHLNIN